MEQKSGRLLVVDDEVELVDTLCDILSEWGYEAAGCTSGKDALEILKKQKFDLLLVDLVMTEMDGIELLQAALEEAPSLVCIIITGKGTIYTAVEAMKLGAFDYVLKPLDFDMLKQCLFRAMKVRHLREAEEKYRSIFENAIGGIYQITPDGRYITANLALAHIIGYESPSELIMNLTDIGRQLYVNPDRYAEFIHLMQESDSVSEFESQVYCKDGSKIWISENAVAVHDASGRLLYYQGIVENITERKRAENELKHSREQLRNLSAYLQSVREKERMNIAREIHDELGQALTALNMDLFWLNNKLPGEQKFLREKIKSMSGLVDKTIKTVQRISAELRPGLLDDLGLAAAIEWQAKEFQNRTGIKCEVSLYPEDIILSQDISVTIFRIFQEALTNVVRHANATWVKSSLSEKADKIELEVRDNGKGITEEQICNPKSFGLIGIRERAHLLGGEVKIIGIRDKGTTIIVTVPLNKERGTL